MKCFECGGEVIQHLECGDASLLSNTGTRPGDQSADPSAHSKVVALNSDSTGSC